MALVRLFLVISMLLVTWSSTSFGELIPEKSIDDEWMVNIITENSVHVTVDGQGTHGDGLHVRLVKRYCEKGNLLTFVYTYIKHPEIKKLGGKYLPTKFMSDEVTLKILYTSPFLMGLRATIDIGWASLDKLKKILSKENPISIEYVDSNEIKIKAGHDAYLRNFGCIHDRSLSIDKKKVIKFQEKPDGDNAWINGGFFVINKKKGMISVNSKSPKFDPKKSRK